jgi:predicted nuclease of predicted toxin-antitoxin system
VFFVLDQQLPATLADWFIAKGLEAIHVRDLGMRDAPDTAIWNYALVHDGLVVTKAKDFAVRRLQMRGPRVLWLKLGNTTNAVLRAHPDRVWPDVLGWLETGESVVEA